MTLFSQYKSVKVTLATFLTQTNVLNDSYSMEILNTYIGLLPGLIRQVRPRTDISCYRYGAALTLIKSCFIWDHGNV